MIFIKFISEKLDLYKKLIQDNKVEITEINYRILKQIIVVSGLLMSVVLIVSNVLFDHKILVPAYISALILSIVLFLFRNSGIIKNHPLIFLYLLSIFYIGVTTYINIMYHPEYKATFAIGLFCIVPMIFIDNPFRIDLFIFLSCLLHCGLGFVFKDIQVASADAMNCFSFVVVGCYIGNTSMFSRLSEADLRRCAELEKRTDVLTGIGNRRYLFETIGALEKESSRKPVGAIMFDIDDFKSFNDKFGHFAGDKCLTVVGEIIKEIQKIFNNKIIFYRYGGDEFVAFAFDFTQNELEKLSELLQNKTSDMDIDGKQIKISIGISYCGYTSMRNYEKLIEAADIQLYKAKASSEKKIFISTYSE